MIENDTQNSRQAASAALRNAPKLAKIAQAGVQGGPAGAATEAAVQYRKEVLVVVIAVFAAAGSGAAHAARRDFRYTDTAQHGGQQRFRSCCQRDTASQCYIEYFAGSLRGYPCRNRIRACKPHLQRRWSIPWAVMSPTMPFSSFPCTPPTKERTTIPKSA